VHFAGLPRLWHHDVAFVQAFYIPWGPDLQRWAATHPEYSKQQLASLIALIADSQGLKRKDKLAALAAIDAELVE
jgi:hypothetical protein